MSQAQQAAQEQLQVYEPTAASSLSSFTRVVPAGQTPENCFSSPATAARYQRMLTVDAEKGHLWGTADTLRPGLTRRGWGQRMSRRIVARVPVTSKNAAQLRYTATAAPSGSTRAKGPPQAHPNLGGRAWERRHRSLRQARREISTEWEP